MNKVIRTLVTGLIAVLLMLVLPVNAGAVGLATGPSEMEITYALSGEEYQETIFLKYTNDGECIVQFRAVGDISDWVSFYEPNDPTSPIESITALPGEWTYILVKFNIPSDALTGTVIGTIYAQTVPLEGGGGAAVSLQGTVNVTIDIVGEAEGKEETAGPISNVTTDIVDEAEGEEETAGPSSNVTTDIVGEAEGEEETAEPISKGLIIGIIGAVVLVAIVVFALTRRRA